MSLRDEVVLVTGGAQGIGAAVVEAALGQGARVASLDLSPDSRDDVLELRADITSDADVRRAVAAVEEGLGPVSVLVNNAGRNAYHDPVSISEDEWDAVFSVDLKSVWLCSRAVLPAMRGAGGGSIVNIASLHAKLTTKGMFPYAAAKSGVVGLTRSLALDVAGDGIRVNSVSPGWTRTRLVQEWFDQSDDPEAEAKVLGVHPFGRIAEPSEVAQVVCFLGSRAASYVTGADWAVDGGYGIRFA